MSKIFLVSLSIKEEHPLPSLAKDSCLILFILSLGGNNKGVYHPFRVIFD